MKKFLIIFLMFVMMITSVSAAITDGLVSYYNYDTNANPTFGTGDGTVTGASQISTSECLNDGCYTFDGTNDYISYNTATLQPTTFSLSVNVKIDPSTTTDAYHDIFNSGRTATTAGWHVNVFGGTGGVALFASDGGYDNQLDSTDIRGDIWRNILVTYDGTTMKAYINGTYISAATLTNSLSYGNLLSYVGGRPGVSSWNGEIDDLALWNRVLSGTEITEVLSLNGIVYSTPAEITLSSYVVTPVWNNSEIWNTNISSYVYTYDDTPTVSFDTNILTNCSIGLSNLNYSAMILDDSATECSTSETLNHTCTLPASKSLTSGNDEIYISCVSTTGGIQKTAGPHNINLDRAPTVPTDIVFSPSTIYTNDTLTVTASGSTDADSDTITYLYRFEVGAYVRDYSSNNQIELNETYENETLTVRTIASTSTHNSSVYFETIIINEIPLNNVPTNPTDIVFNPSSLDYIDLVTVTASGSTDADNDSLVYYYNFFINGTEVQSYSTTNTFQLNSSYINLTLNVFTKAYDGLDFSSEYNESIFINDMIIIETPEGTLINLGECPAEDIGVKNLWFLLAILGIVIMFGLVTKNAILTIVGSILFMFLSVVTFPCGQIMGVINFVIGLTFLLSGFAIEN